MKKYPAMESAVADMTCTHGLLSSPDDCPSNIPPVKRRRINTEHQLDESAGFMFPHVEEPGRRASGPSSIMHPSGRVLPVGIAQPIQSREHEEKDPMADWTDIKPCWKEGEGGETDPFQTKGCHQSTSSSADVDAAVQKVMSQLKSDLSSSGTDSSSSTDDDDDGMESGQQQNKKQQYGIETRNIVQSIKTKGSTSAQLARTSPSTSLPPIAVLGSSIPPGKKLHVFLSHSTGDQYAVKGNIVVPLREAHGMQVVACYHCMEGPQYNDKHIERAMAESCVVVVALSPSYLESQRCQREWRRAFELASSGSVGDERGACQVVVAAVGKCSRPEKLKNFLYLDFIDRDKRDYVLKKLVDTINTAVSSMCAVPEETDVGQQARDGASGVPNEEGRTTGSGNDRDLLELAAVGEYDVSDAHQRRLEAEFEADFGVEFGAEFRRGWGGEEQIEYSDAVSAEADQMLISSDPRMTELATGRGGDSRQAGSPSSSRSQQDRQSMRRGKTSSEEVEEGEVSDSSSEGKAAKNTSSDPQQSQQVARFYDELAQPDADKRDESPIFYMRNFNNWVKSVLLRTYIQPHYTVLDLCCGKGGDLLKWKEGCISYLICADISESSVEACKGRYNSHRMAVRGTRKPPFEAEFYVADCCSVRLRDLYQNSGCSFNIVSCQFSVHYSFESYSRAHMMLRNACENLRPGGFFIGTTVDSNEIVRRLREANQRNEDGSWYIGNKVFSVTLDPSLDPWKPLPLFKAVYNFKLHGVVDLPEFLVHFPVLIEILKDFDMELVQRQNFTNFFSEQRYHPHNANLLYKMRAFDKQHGTMPSALWEVIGLYLVYVFRKKDHKDMAL